MNKQDARPNAEELSKIKTNNNKKSFRQFLSLANLMLEKEILRFYEFIWWLVGSLN